MNGENQHERIAAPARLIVLMGVAGCGKTSVGLALAGRLGIPFLDADDFHTPENVAKMAGGVPLTDDDRWPWLDRVAGALVEHAARDGLALAGCSALRRIYRQRMTDAAGAPILFILLDGPRDLIAERMAARRDHYMPPSLLDSQIAILEPPEADEDALVVSIGPSVADLAETIHRQLEQRGNHR